MKKILILSCLFLFGCQETHEQKMAKIIQQKRENERKGRALDEYVKIKADEDRKKKQELRFRDDCLECGRFFDKRNGWGVMPFTREIIKSKYYVKGSKEYKNETPLPLYLFCSRICARDANRHYIRGH